MATETSRDQERRAEERDKAARRERLLSDAKMVRHLDPGAQRWTLQKLIFESVGLRACTPDELLEAAFDDPRGRRYWVLWLSEPVGLYQFVELLALHNAGNAMTALDGHLREIFERLRAAAEANETWLVGDSSPLLTEDWSSGALRICALAVRPREAIAWLLQNPNSRHLVPTTPREMVESSVVPAISPPATGMTDDQIETETNSTPVLSGNSIPRGRRGPKPGTVDRLGEPDRALFPNIKRIMKKGPTSCHAACIELAEAGKVKGTGTLLNRAKRLAQRFRKEHLSSENSTKTR